MILDLLLVGFVCSKIEDTWKNLLTCPYTCPQWKIDLNYFDLFSYKKLILWRMYAYIQY